MTKTFCCFHRIRWQKNQPFQCCRLCRGLRSITHCLLLTATQSHWADQPQSFCHKANLISHGPCTYPSQLGKTSLQLNLQAHNRYGECLWTWTGPPGVRYAKAGMFAFPYDHFCPFCPKKTAPQASCAAPQSLQREAYPNNKGHGRNKQKGCILVHMWQ